MPSPIETLLTTIGLPAEDIAKVTTIPEADQPAFDAKPYADKVRANYSTQLQNDPAFFTDMTIEKLPTEINKKISDKQFGRAAKIATDKLLKGLGMSEADFADLPDDQREKMESLIPIIVERYAKTKAGDKQLQADLIEARKKLEQYGPDYEKGVETKYQTASDQKVTAAILNATIISELSAIPGLKIAAGDIGKTAHDILAAEYGFERVGDFAVELRRKDNTAMKVLKPNSSQELTLKEALLDVATKRGWVEVKPVATSGSGVTTIVPNKNGTLEMVVPPHLKDKFSKKIAAEQGQ